MKSKAKFKINENVTLNLDYILLQNELAIDDDKLDEWIIEIFKSDSNNVFEIENVLYENSTYKYFLKDYEWTFNEDELKSNRSI